VVSVSVPTALRVVALVAITNCGPSPGPREALLRWVIHAPPGDLLRDRLWVVGVVCACWVSVPREVIAVAVRWYLRYGLSYRDVEELLAERGVEVNHVTIYRWVQVFTLEFIEAARPARHVSGDRWFVDETYSRSAVGGPIFTARLISTGR
jgi:hypothetical protein